MRKLSATINAACKERLWQKNWNTAQKRYSTAMLAGMKSF